MNSQPTPQMQQLMQDLESGQQKLGEQLARYQALQQEIAELQAKAQRDPQARQRLERIRCSELQPLRDQLEAHIGKLQTKVSTFESIFKSYDADASARTKPKPANHLGRQFI